jgi:glutamyl/glutaminyl-tRNA synthetase
LVKEETFKEIQEAVYGFKMNDGASEEAFLDKIIEKAERAKKRNSTTTHSSITLKISKLLGLQIFKPKNFEGELGEQMRVIEQIIADAPAFETLNQLERYITQKSGLEGENLLNPLRVLLTGAKSGPKLSEIYSLIKSYILEVAS